MILLLIAIIAGVLFALPTEAWDAVGIAAAGVAGMAFVRSWRRNVREMHARGERVWTRGSVIAWSIILGGPVVILVIGALLVRLIVSYK